MLADQDFFQTLVNIAFQNSQFVITVFGQGFNFFPLNRQSTLVFVNAVAVKHTHFHHRAGRAGRQFQGGIADIRGFLTENGAQKFFFRRHRAFTFRGDFTDQNIARIDLGTDINNTGLVQITQRFFTDIGNITGDFFRPQFGVTRHHLKFLNVNGGKDIVAHNAF